MNKIDNKLQNKANNITEEVAPFTQIKHFFTKTLVEKCRAKKHALMNMSRQRGYALIVLVLFFWYLGVVATSQIVLTNTVQLRDTQLEIALDQAENIGIGTASPIRNYINDQVYKRVQNQVIEHLQLNKSTAESYICQDQPTPTEKNGGSLTQQFGLCNPVRIMDGLDGDTNQTLDLLSFAYPNSDKPIDDPYKNNLRLSVVEQAQNKYHYTLRSTFVGQQVLYSGAGERVNRYRYLVRADVETYTYFNVINQLVMHFDVMVDETYYPIPFDGVDCDQPAKLEENLILPAIVLNAGTEQAMVCTDGITCVPVGVLDKNGEFCPYGKKCYTDICGRDPFCGIPPGHIRGCVASGKGDAIQCPVPKGTYIGDVRPFGIRPTRGCASARTNEPDATGLDPDGYTFTVITRLVSIGSTYN